MFFPGFNPGAYTNYSDAERALMERVLDNWKVWDLEEKFRVLHNYLQHVNANIYSPKTPEFCTTELKILKRIICILDADEREFLIACYDGHAKLHRAKKQLFEVKVSMLDFCKSQMKATTILEFLNSLVNLPEEFSASPLKDATMLDFLKSLVDLNLPEERKNWLLQKLIENDITGAYDDAMKSFEENEQKEDSYIGQLEEVLGTTQYQEDNAPHDEDPCTDMDSFKKRLEVMEKQVEEKSNNVGRVNKSRNPDCVTYACKVKDFIRRLKL
ncbi:hypothetical protein MKW92_047115 [Papaver armeniacum]|nr:hypothetical protein MKW92_047115 [Papaver armeniacum]